MFIWFAVRRLVQNTGVVLSGGKGDSLDVRTKTLGPANCPMSFAGSGQRLSFCPLNDVRNKLDPGLRVSTYKSYAASTTHGPASFGQIPGQSQNSQLVFWGKEPCQFDHGTIYQRVGRCSFAGAPGPTGAARAAPARWES